MFPTVCFSQKSGPFYKNDSISERKERPLPVTHRGRTHHLGQRTVFRTKARIRLLNSYSMSGATDPISHVNPFLYSFKLFGANNPKIQKHIASNRINIQYVPFQGE